jgi:hypothetical protein
MRPERDADPPEQDWGSSVLRDLGVGADPVPGAGPAPGPDPAPSADPSPSDDASPNADPAPGIGAAPGIEAVAAVDNPARPAPGSATLPHRGAEPGPGSLQAALVVGLLLVGAATLVLTLRRRSGPGTAAR